MVPKWKHRQLPKMHREALDMIAHKIGRILNGDHDYADSWDDIAGYARLVADRVRNKKPGDPLHAVRIK